MENFNKTDITEIKKTIFNTIKDLNLEEKKKQCIELESKTILKDFWEDNREAQKILSEVDYITKEIQTAEKLQKDIQDFEEIYLLAENEDEKKQLSEDFENIKRELEKFTKLKFLSGKYDKSGVILSIHAGQGGTEAQDWAEMLLRMYTKYCEKQEWKVNILHMVQGTEVGISSVTLEIIGIYAYGYLRKETGTHRLVRLSPFNAQNLRQTSFAGVEIIPIIEDSNEDFKIDEKDIEFKAVKSGGPGGQHVNKTASAVVIKHIPTGITVHCSEGRDQSKNRQTAMNILKSKLILIQEQEKEQHIQDLKGEHKIAGWGNQIRNYVLHPYKLVKDLRTNVESSNPEEILDGNLDIMLEAQLRI